MGSSTQSFMRAPINFSGSGNNTVIPSDATMRILVHRVWLVTGGATNLTFKDVLSGPAPVPLAQYGTLVFDFEQTPWFMCLKGTAFVINTDQAVQVSGEVHYSLAL